MQRDLFRAEVFAFPLARTIEVPRMVRFLTVCQGDFADEYLRRRCRQMAKALKKAGVQEQEVYRQIREFRSAVQAGLCADASTKGAQA